MLRTSAALLALAALVPAAGQSVAAELRPFGTYVWSATGENFGGFSGLVVDAGGAGFLTVTDRGHLVRASVRRDPGGRIEGVEMESDVRLLDNLGHPVSGFTGDAEALARGTDGMFYVAYESYARITGLRPPDPRPIPLHPWDRFRDLWGNESFEGLAALADGTLLAVVEQAGPEGAYPTLVGSGTAWNEGPPIPGAGGYAAADITRGPDGRLYLLERKVSIFGRFSTRVRRFDFSGGAFEGGETLLETAPGVLDNMEGISLWERPDSRRFVTLISDDNFRSVQNTVIAEYEIVE